MTTLVWAVVCIVLAAAGAGLGYWLGIQRRAVESAKLDAVQAELDDYRKRVSEHFGETATRFHDLGRQYRELYEHMAAGSQDLCDVDDAGGKLPFAAADRPAIEAGEQVAEAQAAHDDPGSDESARTEHDEASPGESVPTAAEPTETATADDGQPQDHPAPEESAEPERPARTYH